MSTTPPPAQEIWMSVRERSDLEREAGYSFASDLAAHHFRMRRMKERLVDSMLNRVDPLNEFLAAENARRLEDKRQATQHVIGLNVMFICLEIFECLKLQSFPLAETESFLQRLEQFSQEIPALLCMAEATRIRRRTGR
jgi:hypothetical protein